MSKFVLLTFVAVALIAVGCFYLYGRSIWVPAVRQVSGDRTVQDVIALYGEDARKRLAVKFESPGQDYPPANATFLATKDNAQLELWVGPPSVRIPAQSDQ